MTPPPTSKQFPVVGVGASAGGIDSFKKFLGAIPEDSGMAFILVQHLSPSHESILPEILSHATKIPVREITDDCQIEPNTVYVIPENKMLKVTDHSLKLSPREKDTVQLPIDVFFTSLAQVHKTEAVGVVLSGTARDGTVGLKEIQEHGGIAFAEDPDMAAWPGMPKSAVDAGVVDFVLPAGDIPAKLVRVRSAYTNGLTEAGGEDGDVSEPDAGALRKILSLLLRNNGVDFNYYKQPTVLRRIERRMAINQMSNHDDYLDFLRNDRSEQAALFQDLLIKVTSFFRDTEVFGQLCETVLPKLLKGRSNEDPLRVWVVGCATGEEVYSLAICLFESLGGIAEGADRHRAKIQLFATDISETAIKKARMGVYRTSELESVSEDRLNTYFTKTDGSYRVIKPVRDTIVFAVHNFLKDPPFSRVDLISCRNVFIYLDTFLQKKALTTFHYSLKENGLLLMGKSETPGKPTELFAPFSKKEKLFSRKPGAGRFSQTLQNRRVREKRSSVTTTAAAPASRTDFKRSAERVLISKYSPASVIVDEHMTVVDIRGDVSPFLEHASGKPSHELLKMARKELSFELRNALHKAKESQDMVQKQGIPFNYSGQKYAASLEIVPLTDIVEPHYLILFQKDSPGTTLVEKLGKKVNSAFTSSEKTHLKQRNTALEKELEQLREDVRGITEEQEANNEELQSANEELLSSNEEMQSLNEELETSKEEVQSTNEELIVVNRELIEKQDELNDTLDFLDAIIATVREPFLVLEKDYRVHRANAAFSKKFDVDEKEISGTSFFEIQDGKWSSERLRGMLEKVLLEQKQIVGEEIEMDDPLDGKRIYMFNAREIAQEQEDRKFILLAIEDITHRKNIENDLKNSVTELSKTNEQLDRYVHLASHDLQEPLRKIMIFSDRLANRGSITAEADKTMIRKIDRAAERMSELVKGLLDYSRVAHHRDLFETTDLEQVVGDILSDFELLIEEKEARVKVGELPKIEAVPLQMGQLLNNLIGNALKFSKKGVAPEVRISARALPKNRIVEHVSLSPDRSYIELTVSDNGIGFDPKYQEQIFMIFQRLRQSKEHQGSGIGLSLVKKIIENHQGAVYTVSEEGQGAEFHVILPIEQPGL